MNLKETFSKVTEKDLQLLAGFLAKFMASPNGQFILELMQKYNLSEIQPYMEDDEELKKADKEGITFGELLADRERMIGIVERAKAAYDKAVKPLPKMPKRPDSYTTSINLLAKTLTEKPLVNAGPRDLPVNPKKGITTYVAIAYDKEKNPFNLTPKQITIMEAAGAVYEQGKADGIEGPIPMTPVSIFKAMPGGSTKPTPAKLREIEAMMSMFRDMPAEIEATSELRAAGKIGSGERFHLKTNLILANEARYSRRNGTETIGWQVFEMPVVCAYARKTGQVVSVSTNVVQVQEMDPKTGKPTGALLSINDNRRELLAYLVRRVGVMHNDFQKAKNEATKKRNRESGKTWKDLATKSHRVLYDTAFEAAGVTSTKRTIIAGLKDFILDVLKYWKAIGYISDFLEVKEGRKRRGVDIFLGA